MDNRSTGTGVAQSLFLADPHELIIQPEVPLDERPESNIIKAALVFDGCAYEALFTLRPPQILTLAHKGIPVDERLPSERHLLSLLQRAAFKLANQLLVGDVEGAMNDETVQEAQRRTQEEA